VAEARGAIRDEGYVTEWGTPVLYSRALDGRLFDVTGPARVEAERPAQEDAAPEVVEEAGEDVLEADEDDVLEADEDDVLEADEDDEFEPWEEEDRPARTGAAGEAQEAIRLQTAAQDLLATIEKVKAGLDSAGMDDTGGAELASPPRLGPAGRDSEPSPPFQRGERVQLGSIFGDSPRPPRWTVDLVKSSTYGRTLAIRLSHETHVLEIRIRKFRDSISVDGKPVTRSSAIAHKNQAFSMSDGPQLRAAGVWVETDKANHITHMKLTLDGQIFYYE
jgi:hypothetical protein